MSEEPTAAKETKGRGTIAVLRQRTGGMSPRLKEYFKEQQRIRKVLRRALESGPMTIPELATACTLASPVVMWHVMAMRRYGELIEGDEKNGYMVYSLKEG